jgi:biopolymer transport protein ExbB
MIEFLRQGGPVMWPLLICSVLAVAIIVERMINLRPAKVLPEDEVEHLGSLIGGGLLEQAEDYCERRPGPLTNIVAAALEARGESADSNRQVVVDQGRQEVPRLQRYLGILGTVASVSPLLGLLGTVLGMIEVFQVVSSQGIGQAESLAGGISEAMITTATGLTIAIPALVAYNAFSDRANAMILEMERLALAFIKQIVQQHAAAPRDDRAPVAVSQRREQQA